MKSTCPRYHSFIGIAVAGLTLAYARNSAAAVDLGFNQLFTGSGNTAPSSGATPWAEATFTDNGDGTVNLMLSNPHLTGVESVSDFYFNFANANTSVANLSFSTVAGGASGSFVAPTFVRNQDSLMADGDGKYDFTIDFTRGSDTSKTFGAGDTLLLKISASNPVSNPISASNFDSFSVSSGGQGPYLAAAHIQNTPDSPGAGSAWLAANLEAVPLPEPAMGSVAGTFTLGVAIVGFLPKRRFSSMLGHGR